MKAIREIWCNVTIFCVAFLTGNRTDPKQCSFGTSKIIMDIELFKNDMTQSYKQAAKTELNICHVISELQWKV